MTDSPKPFYRSDGQVGNLNNTIIRVRSEQPRPATPNDFDDIFAGARPVPVRAVGTTEGFFDPEPGEENPPCIFEPLSSDKPFDLEPTTANFGRPCLLEQLQKAYDKKAETAHEPTCAADPGDLLYSLGVMSRANKED